MLNNDRLTEKLANIIGSRSVLCDKESKKVWGKDWTQGYDANPACIVFPKDTLEVAKILAFCNEKNVKVVPSGGRTGLAAAAVASQNEVVLSLDKMNKILELDSAAKQISVEAGVITQVVQEKAKEASLFFPIDLAAKGSSQIGGNIATNAGGLKFIRYGGMREQVVGIEVVLANGEILDLNNKLLKDNSGYDLKQLFIGSEGTLGVITKATLKLAKKPRSLQVSCLALNSPQALHALLQELNAQSCCVTAFEFFTHEAFEKVQNFFPAHSRSLFANSYPLYAVLEFEKNTEEDSSLQDFIELSFEKGLVEDALISQSSEEFNNIWSARENITESLSQYGFVHKNDISFPVSKVSSFLQEIQNYTKNQKSFIEIILFGHIGDGNVHVNYVCEKKHTREEFSQNVKIFESYVFDLIKKMGGSISAEHGIGLLKKDVLKEHKNPDQLEYMRRIKQIFDPKAILNPGKIFDL